MTAVLGSLSDRFGRKKILLIPLFGNLIAIGWIVVLVLLNLHYMFFLLAFLISGATGGFATITTITFAYIANHCTNLASTWREHQKVSMKTSLNGCNPVDPENHLSEIMIQDIKNHEDSIPSCKDIRKSDNSTNNFPNNSAREAERLNDSKVERTIGSVEKQEKKEYSLQDNSLLNKRNPMEEEGLPLAAKKLVRISILQASNTIGGALGSVTGGVFVDRFGSFGSFLMLWILCLLAAIYTVLLLPDIEVNEKNNGASTDKVDSHPTSQDIPQKEANSICTKEFNGTKELFSLRKLLRNFFRGYWNVFFKKREGAFRCELILTVTCIWWYMVVMWVQPAINYLYLTQPSIGFTASTYGFFNASNRVARFIALSTILPGLKYLASRFTKVSEYSINIFVSLWGIIGETGAIITFILAQSQLALFLGMIIIY